MPELRDEAHIEYLKMRLSLDLGEEDATKKFKKEIEESLKTFWRKIDNLVHNIIH